MSKKEILTTRQGHPVRDNQNLRTVGERGPATLENYHFLEKMSHFDRERVPERVVHARGAGAHGYFESYGKVGKEPANRFTRAKVITEAGHKTPVFVRFSTVGGGKESPETMRDPRGFAVKFYTKDGNWDLVGNNLPVFFIRDATKFMDLNHAAKPDPKTNVYEPWRFYDFAMHQPEMLHLITWVKSPWGIPANYREMIGSGVNAYRWINADGESTLIKYHWVPKQGNRNLTAAAAAEIQAKDHNHATRDLFEAIDRGDYPEWEMQIQMMADSEHPELDFDPLDDTKVWPEELFPKHPVGKMVLNKNPENYFAEVEQAAFGTGVLVDGMDFSDDKMLLGRTFSYSDTQRYRVGANYLQLPINRPKVPVRTYQRDGQMAYSVDDAGDPHVNYEPTSRDGLTEAPKHKRDYYQPVTGHVMRHGITRTQDDYKQAGERYRTLEGWEREDLLANIGGDLKGCPENIALRMVWHFYHCDADYGTQLATRAGLDLKKALKLEPLEGHPGPNKRRELTITGTNGATSNGSKKQEHPVGTN
ncbi:MAG TPA: catalase [Candidatus Baltobacteraceae bacterium]|jgi:catalase